MLKVYLIIFILLTPLAQAEFAPTCPELLAPNTSFAESELLTEAQAAAVLGTSELAKEKYQNAIQFILLHRYSSVYALNHDMTVLFTQLAQTAKWTFRKVTKSDNSVIYIGTLGYALEVSPGGRLFKGSYPKRLFTFPVWSELYVFEDKVELRPVAH